MKNNNSIEVIGLIVLIIGTLLWFSKDFYIIDVLSPIYSYGQILFWLGLLVWAVGYMLKKNNKKL